MLDARAWMEWAGCALGVAGSFILALNVRASGWGFVLYLLSNVAWLAFGLVQGIYGLAVQHAAFAATALLGIWQWLIRPRLALREQGGKGRGPGEP